MAGRTVAVHPAVGQGGWTWTELAPERVSASGAVLPGAGGLGLSVGLGLILRAPISSSVLDPATLLAAADSVLAMVEVADPDQVTSGLVCGSVRRPVSGLDLGLIGAVVEVDGVQVATAAGAAAAGHPTHAAVLGLSSGPFDLASGAVIFTGRWTAPIDVRPGSHLQAGFGHLGGIAVEVR